ncbi:M42 family metallopeptidase [Algoriphagus halophytocola]|uniref:M42 family metallopeptidase n=1 Tax=Algoriphagus halophytocola TaxID=2991499 RepID=A0ABY6MGJ9_9BACT|nr:MULTISPECIES: M42 family metallopeptidase [unclassified Algoriphagus]UZD22579.1 M42 family metallopeptidase [Algoriphagus sp. TR-M5]WBL43845.1 M42 family metallopeptidase [Algoriphagus sp. TR-M9]
MDINVSLLKQICEIAGAPGFEKRVRDLVIELVTPLADEVKTDNIGNVIAIKKGKRNPDGKRVMVAAHMDEIGFIVTHIDDNGFLRFHTLGGFDPKTLTAQRVIVHGKKDLVGVMGSKPIHVMSTEERAKLPKTRDFFIDLGMPKEEVEKYISVGDPVTRDRELIEMGDCVNCKSIDNRVAVFILLEALRELKDPAYDVYATFTVQEEVGLRGANVAAHGINPDFGIALDTTIAFDVPGAQAHEKVTELGKGTAIKIMDAMTICDYRMVEFMKQTADKATIAWQPEILVAGGTDTAGVQRMGKQGAIAGAISIPTRHLHQVIEMAHKKDIADSIALLKACLEQVDSYDWKH